MTVPFSYRNDPTVPSFADDKPIIVFDGQCVFCSAWARFVLTVDRKARYRLLPAQTPLGRALYRHLGLDPKNYETNILIENGVAYFKADGSIRMAMGLGFPWSLAVVLRAIPKGLRDRLYDIVARNRYHIFGQTDVCYAPRPEYRDRFLA
jgi:predicted DCC family thiol-disulfide oxidoreductase YuxK